MCGDVGFCTVEQVVDIDTSEFYTSGFTGWFATIAAPAFSLMLLFGYLGELEVLLVFVILGLKLCPRFLQSLSLPEEQ